MTLQECTIHHLQHMRAACIVVAQQYRVLGREGYDEKVDCTFCNFLCEECPWEVVSGEYCQSAGYIRRSAEDRIHTLETDWIPKITTELIARGVG